MTFSSPHILVVDDDPALRELISEYLLQNEIRVTAVASGAGMDAVLEETVIDLVLLDLRLKGEDGMELARRLRETSELPVIIVSGIQDEADRVMGLELAADDYVTKPFSNREMLARIRAVLRRYRARAEKVATDGRTRGRAFRFADWELNLAIRRLTSPAGKRVGLSNGELNLLLALCKHSQRVLSRDQLLELSRLHEGEVYDRSIDSLILRLRRKIEVDASAPKIIRTERGAGYVLEPYVQVLY